MEPSLPSALRQLQALDPELYRSLAADFDRLARASEALVWSHERLPELLGAPDPSALLQMLVRICAAETGAPIAWGLLWDRRSKGAVSFRAVAGDGAETPDPTAISGTLLGQVAAEGRPSWSHDAQNDARFDSSQSVVAYSLRSVGCLPVGEHGAVYLADPDHPGRFTATSRDRLAALTRLAGALLATPPPAARRRVAQPVPGIVGNTPAMAELFDQIRAFAPMPWPAMVLGESGTGKEATARALHDLSERAGREFVPVNCGAIPADLAESTLFGHERGAFTGADRRREGVVERVRGGTLFLDEVGELPPPLQVKLLRLLQEGTFERVGGERPLRFEGRVVAATNRDLDRASGRSEFREDLYYRLSSCVLRVPSLAERRDDIPALAAHLLERNLAELGGKVHLTLSPAAVRTLVARPWPGNVRELGNAVRTAIARAIAARASQILPEHLGGSRGDAAIDGPVPTTDLEGETDRFQRRMVEAALEAAGGNRTRAAEQLGVSRQWLHRLIARWEG